MKYSFSVLAVAALASLAAAQLPSCAQPCIDAATKSSTKCAVGDVACACIPANAAAIQGAATSCVLSACGAQAGNVLTAAQALCANLPASSAAPAASSSAAPAPASSSSAAPASASSSSAAPAMTTATTMMTTTATDCGCTKTSAPVASTTAKSNSTAPSSSPVPFTGGASQVAAGLGSVFALGLAALAAL